MHRPKRADKNASYYALNRGHGRSVIFHKDGDYEASENILADGLVRYPCRILSYQVMPNHWHFVLQPTEAGGMSDFLCWATLTHTLRFRSHYLRRARDMCTKADSRVSQSGMTIISTSCVGMSNATHFEPNWSSTRRIGGGVSLSLGSIK